ncbi:MAG TPA: DNA ligase D [Coriobacteriia bacterium]|nr:DNA ligase D [Coriobacteriia bacterium]
MALEEYRRKRDFGLTPEPSGERADAHAGLAYVIQKHAASHLHWDFRIELDGVMLSWAIPKGPSLDPKQKRLAMRVEDHPIDYGSFEGVIPKGEYGGGTVMIWDRGTWEPDHGDPRAHLDQGHLKFYLFGERLRGRWMILKTKGYGKKPAENTWLLFKEHDEDERPAEAFEATAEWTTSVATGRTMDEISADLDAVWHSTESVEQNVAETTGLHPALAAAAGASGTGAGNDAAALDALPGAVRSPMPAKIEVELATLVKTAPEGEKWLHEIKFDGYRMLAFVDAGKVRMVSRSGKDWTGRFAEIETAAAALPATTAILDGEVVVLRADGTNDFQALQNYARRGHSAELHYMAFDLLYLDGVDLRGVPLTQRKQLLFELLPRHSDRLRYTDHIEGHGDVFFSRACDFSLEGIVSKRRDAPYRAGRGHDWLKTKCLLRQEFVVVGYTDPGGTRSAFGALVLALYEDGRLVHTGRAGSGFTEESLADIFGKLQGTEVDEPPVINPPTGPMAKGIHWVTPTLVAEVTFAEWTEERSLRHPTFLGLREDKPIEDVVAETAADTPPSADALSDEDEAAAAGSGGTRTSFAGVTLSNPDRVLWPDAGVTKSALAEYYERVAPLMLPHVAQRPLSLVRCPTGYTGECFYQKHIDHFPKAVGTVGVFEPESDKTMPYACIKDFAGIVGLVQMGVLEIHPWGSRADQIEKPDRLIFDLDPDPELPWSVVAGTALLLRVELARLGLESWVKSTGGKGLHVVVPVRRRHDWTASKDFCHAFVEHIVRIEPRLFTSNMNKAKRTGKVFIDYLRNARGATAVAPYSTRARPGAPVAVPMSWNELEGTESRPEFTVINAAEWLERGADPWADLPSASQSITVEMMGRLEV